MQKILGAILIVVPASVLLTAQASLSAPAAEQCRASPGSSTPPGSHWYYRISRGDKHCWYLGAEGARVNARATASLPSTLAAPEQKRSGAEPEGAARPQAAADETASVQIAPAPPAAARVGFLPATLFETALRQHGMRTGFAVRWPDNLPDAVDAARGAPAAMSNSYAEGHGASDAAAQIPPKWPVVEAARASQVAAGDTALRYFALAGVLAMPLLLFAGWAAKLAPRLQQAPIRDQWHMVVDWIASHWLAQLASLGAGKPPARTLRGGAQRPLPLPMPTDPAHDLKTSLAELMRDLRQAGIVNDPVYSFAGPGYQTDDAAYQPALEAAE
jgi:hypothetical protein